MILDSPLNIKYRNIVVNSNKIHSLLKFTFKVKSLFNNSSKAHHITLIKCRFPFPEFHGFQL